MSTSTVSAWNESSFHRRSGGCICARRGCTFSTSVAQMQLACSPAGIFFCENSERTYVIQCLSRARRRGLNTEAQRTQRGRNHRWTQMDTDRNWKPDLTPESSTKEGPGGTERNVETSKCRNQGLGMRGRGLRRGCRRSRGKPWAMSGLVYADLLRSLAWSLRLVRVCGVPLPTTRGASSGRQRCTLDYSVYDATVPSGLLVRR